MFEDFAALFANEPLPCDTTGALRRVGELVAELGPEVLFLARRDGTLLAIDSATVVADAEELKGLAARCAQAVQTRRLALLDIDGLCGPRLAFAVRLPFEAMGCLLGGVVVQSGERSRQALQQQANTLTLCGWLVLAVLEQREQVHRAQTRLRQLQVEQETLRRAHSKAIAEALEEQQKRIAAEQLYSRRLELEVERRSADLRLAIDEARRQADEARQTAEALARANYALEEFSQAAEEANRAKSDFLANMSHELRTPLTAILGHAELVLDRLTPDNPAHEPLTIIQKNGRHLLSLINDVLDLAKIEAGKVELDKQPFSLRALLDDLYALLEPRAAQRGLTLRFVLPPSLPEVVETDPTRLKQVLLNLLGNSIKFTERGWIELRAEYRPRSRSQGELQFEVSDTGVGMSPEQVKRLFRPFSQADGSTTRRFGGTGLGLAISRHLAAKLGGTLTVESELGRGSTFTVTVAVRLASQISGTAEADHASDPQALPSLHDCNILLVEDSPDNRRLIAMILERAGAHVIAAENGQDALDRYYGVHTTSDDVVLQRPEIDLILMDMQMPVMDGYEATRILRQRGCRVPIVALTANAMVGDRQKCLDAGCTDFATKPVDRRRLLTLAASYTAASRARRAARAGRWSDSPPTEEATVASRSGAAAETLADAS
jgi:signal transduction histidine kinase/DNA-binding response OmpR family regulator